MKKYKKGDKLVVQVTDVDDNEPQYHIANKGDGRWLDNNDILGKLEDFQPEQEKIKMTVEEMKEFDELNKDKRPVYDILKYIDEYIAPHLFTRLYGLDDTKRKNQLEFVKALEYPELIEVEHEEKRLVKISNMYLYKDEAWLCFGTGVPDESCYFTKSEIEEINKLPQFKHVDLVSAWEDGE